MNFDELKQIITTSSLVEVGGGATEADLRAAEASLGLTIRGDYRRFLLEYGWGGVGYLELWKLRKTNA
jgi:hypothetical protein